MDKEFFYPKRFSARYVQVNDMLVAPWTQVVTDGHSRTNFRKWDKVPAWKAKLHAGLNATSPFSGEEYYIEQAPTNRPWLETKRANGGTWYKARRDGDVIPIFSGFGTLVGPNESKANSLALTYFYKKLRDTQTKMSGQVFLGEAREVVRMIKSPAKALRSGIENAYRSFSKIRIKRRSDPTLNKVLADSWLEWNFGWKPFFNDIADAAEAFESLFEKDPTEKILAIGVDEIREDLYPETNMTTWGTDGAILRNVTDFKKVLVIYRGGVRDKRNCGLDLESPDSPAKFLQMQRFGLELDEFIPTAWELLPWSFLVDYFTNIGDILEAVATSTSNLTWINKTVIKECRRVCTAKIDYSRFKSWYPENGSYIVGDLGNNPFVFVSRSVNRVPVWNLGYPDFRVELPTSPFQWANMLALLASTERQNAKFFKSPGGSAKDQPRSRK